MNDPKLHGGRATIRGTRLTVDFVLDRLAAGWSATDLLTSFPSLTEDGLRSCLAYAANSVRAERVYSVDVAV